MNVQVERFAVHLFGHEKETDKKKKRKKRGFRASMQKKNGQRVRD